MDGKTNATKGYSSYTHTPANQGGNDHVPQNPVNQQVVNTKTINKVRAPVAGYTNQFGSPTKFELLNEYVYGPNMSWGSEYAPTSNYDVNNKPNNGITHDNSNRSILTKPVLGYSSEKSDYGPGLVGTKHVRTKEFFGPNQSLKGARPRGTQSEAMRHVVESINHLLRLDQKQEGLLDNLATRERPLERKSHYSRPPLVAANPNNVNRIFTHTKVNY